MVPKKEREYKNGPLPIDESWWTAILDDVETQHGEIKSEKKFHDFSESSPLLNSPAEDKENDEESQSELRSESTHEIDWEFVKDLYDRDQLICLKVINFNKGGLLVRGKKIQGFVPFSHLTTLSEINSKEERNNYLSNCVGNSMLLKVIECEPERGRVVFSERAAQSDPGSRLELLNSMCEGDSMQGKVTTVTDFGVFVDLGGIEGLIHISELSWGRVCHPESVVSTGDDISVKVLGIDKEKSRVALSLKRLSPNPWETIHDRYQPGEWTKAVITNIVSFGAFARLEDGLDGLIHVSEFRKSGCEEEIKEIYSEGQQIDVLILSIDSGQQRLGLGLPEIGDEGM